jgi:hypothetical protein
MAQAAVHRAQEASVRLARILDAGQPKTKNVWKPAVGCVGVLSLICLAVAPHTPKFVAFERGPQAAQPFAARSYATAATPVRDQFPGAVVIPAALHMNSTPLPKESSKSDSGAAWRVARHRAAVPKALPGLQAKLHDAPVRPVNAAASEDTMPPLETILLIRTTERTGPDSWRWSVYMYRLVWMNPVQEGSEKAPMPHKT